MPMKSPNLAVSSCKTLLNEVHNVEITEDSEEMIGRDLIPYQEMFLPKTVFVQ